MSKMQQLGISVFVKGFIPLSLALGMALSGTGRGIDDSMSPAKKAIQRVLDEQSAAWNKGDLKAFMSGYWNSQELSFFSGNDKTRGWQSTLERYQKRYQAEGKEMGKLSFTEIEIDILSTEAALVRGRWRLVLSKETVGGLFTLIFKMVPEGWRIVHDHTSG
jgi:beta-aspartyl-peptidase (threonine type)